MGRFFITLIIPLPLIAQIYVSPGDHQLIEDQVEALQLQLEFNSENFIQQRLILNEKIAKLRLEIDTLNKSILNQKKVNDDLVLKYDQQVRELTAQRDTLQQRLESAKEQMTENNRLFEIQLGELNQKIQSLTSESSEKEKELLANADRLEKKLLAEVAALTEKLEILRKEHADQRKKDLDEFNQKSSSYEDSISGLKLDLQVSLSEKELLEKEIANLKALNEEQKNKLDKLSQQANRLEEQLEKEIAEGSIKLKRLQNRLIINLDNRILFESAKSDLKDDAIKETLDKIGLILAEYPNNDILVEGHTDNYPINTEDFRDNWQLSTERALSVLNRLLSNQRLDPSRFSAVGAGQFRPLESNRTKKGRALNRRVDIVVLPKLSESDSTEDE